MAGYPTNDLGLKGFLMNILHNAGRVVTRTADATTAAAGAVGALWSMALSARSKEPLQV